MSIASEITRIKGKVADSFTACGAKGATIPESEVIANLPTCIESIQTGGSSAVLGTKSITANGTYNAVDDSLDGYSAVTVDVQGGDEPVESGFRVRFIDYDGEVLKTQYVESGEDATAPTPPVRDGLTFQEWNNTYTNITRDKDIGACYTSTSGGIDFYFKGNKVYKIRIKYSTSSIPSFSSGTTENTTSGTSFYAMTYDRVSRTLTPTAKLTLVGDSQLSCFVLLENTNKLYPLYDVKLGGNVAIGDYSFTKQQQLSRINIPINATIGNYAFYYCYRLEGIVIPNGITNISTYAFYNCYGLREIILPESLQSIGKNAFFQCYSLREIILPESLQSIGSNAFYQCYGLREIILPESLQSIGSQAFINCYAITKYIITRTDAVITIENTRVFDGYHDEMKIYVPDALLDDYKTATNWVTYKSRIYPLSDLEE